MKMAPIVQISTKREELEMLGLHSHSVASCCTSQIFRLVALQSHGLKLFSVRCTSKQELLRRLFKTCTFSSIFVEAITRTNTAKHELLRLQIRVILCWIADIKLKEPRQQIRVRQHGVHLY
jgi:hypothetical protein